MVRELHGPVVVDHEVFNVGRLIKDRAVLVIEDADLDAGSAASANGSGVVLALVFAVVVVAVVIVAVVLVGILETNALCVFGGIDVSVGLHVLDVLALIVASGGIDAITHPGLVVLVVLVSILAVGVVLVVGVLGLHVDALVASIAVLLLNLLLVLKSGLEVLFHVHDVLSVVVVARAARGVGAKTEDHEALGGQDGIRAILVVVPVNAVLLDELALLELDRV
mmetsp:Transcript_30947/g.65290  ORF Transcript_30947/g.65290 Transcript_30947/m.65290 type:complete len:223 (+) Transcript_30947:691-1359(+)